MHARNGWHWSTGVALALAFLVVPEGAVRSTAAAPQAPSPRPALTTHQLKPNVYWIEGGYDSNSGVIVGDKGVVLFDTKTTPDSEKDVLSEIAKITPKPVVAVILSHSDGDHVGGLPVLPKGVTIIAQENCKKLMEQSAAKGGRGAASTDFLPNKTYDKKLSLTIEDEKLELMHWAPAHTSGDTVLYLPAEKIVFGGDILITSIPLAYLHTNEGGTASGLVKSLQEMAKLDSDTYVPGHGNVTDKSEVQRRADVLQKEFDQVKALVAQGKTLLEIKQTVQEPPSIHPSGMALPLFCEFTYTELTGK